MPEVEQQRRQAAAGAEPDRDDRHQEHGRGRQQGRAEVVDAHVALALPPSVSWSEPVRDPG